MHNHGCNQQVARVPLGAPGKQAAVASAYGGPLRWGCYCLRDAYGNLLAGVIQNGNLQTPACWGTPVSDWSEAASACAVNADHNTYHCSCHYVND